MRSFRRTLINVALGAAAGMVLLWTVRHLASSGSIEIVAAEYGVEGRTCTAGAEIKKHVSEACGGFRPRCLVSVSTGWCGDPAVGVVKTLTVDYKCGAILKRASAPDNSGLWLVCP
jgi:hypothetical protein